MKFNTLVIDSKAVVTLDSALIDDNWFENFDIPPNTEGIRRVVINDSIYLLSQQADLDSILLVVRVGEKGVFRTNAKPRSVFEKILRIGLRNIDRSVSIPVQWSPYNENSFLSVYAESIGFRNRRCRICFDRSPRGSNNIYAFAVTESVEVVSTLDIDIPLYDSAVNDYLDALVSKAIPQTPVGNFGILLSQPLGYQISTSGTLKDWLDRILNKDQLKFINQPLDRPVRLRGAAGTGKTQAMAIKFLRDMYCDADQGGNKVFAFITHSSALAHEVIRGMFYSLDPTGRWAELETTCGRKKMWVGTLYELARELLDYQKKGLEPLSTDGTTGREMQRLFIDEAINMTINDPRISLSLLTQCAELSDQLRNIDNRTEVINEIMNEFACVLDAEVIRKGSPEADAYIKSGREPWQMNLPDIFHRQIMIEIHDTYRKILKEHKMFGLDQMIADFCRYLSTHEWDQLCDRYGFDIVFVDEYHYFTRNEAMMLQSLFKPHAENAGKWPLIMAYDLKQSTNDVAFGGGLSRFKNPGVGESTPVDLNTVYRSTPQITKFLQDIDGSFPAIDLEGEYIRYIGQSGKHDGEIPILLEYDTNIKLIDDVFIRAKNATITSGGGARVAILCLNEELYSAYLDAGRLKGKYVAVTTREDMKELRYAKSRFVFSMPEYVAGLQFDVVFLIHADEADLTYNYISQGARRRYVSRVYLGASRAANELFIATSKERGIVSSVLDGPLKSSSLQRI
ncbi:UvrD-helicase domain-containing protein [Aeromonas salmonicida]|uniref:UvrD-helicase domain-containing protein n=1 Tax=Aeromonas salmonicida TaxID=645 RepID=UPI00259FD10F|nr:UvrD-helicase domain-containing protein [Aeromonas salmonicida]MDM5151553.1 UvrD-helicase domain-containing protein [Aeromonas salmonicida]